MKKLISLVSGILLISTLTACSPNGNASNSVAQTVTYNCNKYDIVNEEFTEDTLLTINLTDEYIPTDSSRLNHQSNIYYIGEYKKTTVENDFVHERVVSVFQYTDPNFTLENNCSKISDNWYIDNKYLENDNNYIRIFFTNTEEGLVGISICNSSKEDLPIDDSIQIMSFITGETCTKPEITEPAEETNSTVEGTLDNPANTDEWVVTTIYNPISKKYEPICITIHAIYNGDIAKAVVEDYNNINGGNNNINLVYSSNEFVQYEYYIFFPDSFTTDENGNIPQITSPITICNTKDNGTGINGYQNLDKTVVDLSPELVNVKPGDIWQDGIGIYEMSVDYNKYLIKITSNNADYTKYFNIN